MHKVQFLQHLPFFLFHHGYPNGCDMNAERLFIFVLHQLYKTSLLSVGFPKMDTGNSLKEW